MSILGTRVYIYDTTLRDGEQTPGVSFSNEERYKIAKKLDAFGVDEIELGFAASNKETCYTMKKIVESGIRAKTLSLARPIESDIDAAVEAAVDGVILFIGLSDEHLNYKFQISFDEAIRKVTKGILYAKEKGLFVQVSAEDGTRTSNERLIKLSKIAEEYGADRICLADTVGIATPELMKEKVECLIKASSLPVAVHCHNDFGLAVINSIAAVNAGARYISATINGLGERAGNASLEQIVCALKLLYAYKTNVDLSQIMSVSKMVENASEIHIEPMKPIIGGNCYRHESGIHVAGIIKNPECYEPYNPELVGAKRIISLGKTSGRAAVHYIAEIIGEKLSDEECALFLERIQKEAKNIDLDDYEIVRSIMKKCKEVI